MLAVCRHEIVTRASPRPLRVEGSLSLVAVGAVAHHPVPQRLVPLPYWLRAQFRNAHEAHAVLACSRAFVEEAIAGNGQGVEERRMVQVEEVSATKLYANCGIAVHCEL